jgi:hypothetical protein
MGLLLSGGGAGRVARLTGWALEIILGIAEKSQRRQKTFNL